MSTTPKKTPKKSSEQAPDIIATSDTGEFALSEVSELDLYQKREKIYTRKIEGFYQRIRVYTGWPLLGFYFLLPWMYFDGRQAVLFDLPSRKFHIFAITFWPQDLAMLAWALAICAFALFLFTSLFGRIWCGYTCPQTVWTSIFMWIEQKTEGSRNQRIKLDSSPWTINKILRKGSKHAMWLGFSFYTGFTFIAYFTPASEMSYTLLSLSMDGVVLFWVAFFTSTTYLNAGWLREQLCIYMCPYARFQSTMFDQNTLIVSYDKNRDEPRGARKREANLKQRDLGDCVNCQICVQVCPTGIDIRDGLQSDCIGCALCIDACNSVMEEMNYPKHLISYTTENKLLKQESKILRPRVIGYGLALVVMCSLLGYKLISRTPLQLDVIRDRGQLYVLKDNGAVENSYTLKLMNMDQKNHHYRLNVSGIDQLKIRGGTEFSVLSGEVLSIPVRLSLTEAHRVYLSQDIVFSALAVDNEKLFTERKSRFIVPAK